MYFTREPIIESVVTPREGCTLVIRNSKGAGQEEFFVDAVEVVNFGSALFFRSMDKPKAFLLPVSDYELLEVRETRVVLKHLTGGEKKIKIGGGREKPSKEEAEPPVERKRRRSRRRRTKEESEGPKGEEAIDDELPPSIGEEEEESVSKRPSASFAEILPPPTGLVSDRVAYYREMLQIPEKEEETEPQKKPQEEPQEESQEEPQEKAQEESSEELLPEDVPPTDDE